MANKAFSIRLSEDDKFRLRKIAELRTKIVKRQQAFAIYPEYPWSEIIKDAIYRMYNETIEYFMYEDEMFRETEETN